MNKIIKEAKDTKNVFLFYISGDVVYLDSRFNSFL